MKQKTFGGPKNENIEINKKVDVEELKDKEWKKQSESDCVRELRKLGAEKFFGGIGNLKEAFFVSDKLVCIDEGILEGYRLPGAGINEFSTLSREERLRKVAAIAIKKGIKKVKSHGRVCGAARLAYERENSGKKPTDEEVNKYAKKWAEDLAETTRVVAKEQGKEIKVEPSHIKDEEVIRPEYHNAVGVYYDSTGKFNPIKLKDKIPPGFVVMCDEVEVEGISKKEIEGNRKGALITAFSIGLGDHGFGERFNPQNPFMATAVGKNPQDLEAKKEEMRKFIESSNFKEDLKNGRIVIGGFVAPE